MHATITSVQLSSPTIEFAGSLESTSYELLDRLEKNGSFCDIGGRVILKSIHGNAQKSADYVSDPARFVGVQPETWRG
jgi:hypothetical protein